VIETGWTKRWRKRWKYGLESTEQGRFTLLIMDFLIDHAAFAHTKEWIKRVGMIEYDRGEAIITISMLAERFNVDPQRIRTSLDQLEKMEFLNKQTNNRFTKIIITNYNTYQDQDGDGNTQTNKQVTGRQQADNTPLIDKKLRIKEEKKQIESDFDIFWSYYPRKEGKAAAIKAWARQNGKRPSIEIITAHIEERKKSEQWTKDNGQFIPLPTTFINQERWNDELQSAASSTPSYMKPYSYEELKNAN
jgi:hypothetical protein